MAPVSKTTDTPSNSSAVKTSDSGTPMSSSGSSANSVNRTVTSSPFVAPKSRWLGNILGKPVDAFQEDDILQAVENSDMDPEIAVEMDEDVSLDDRHLTLGTFSIKISTPKLHCIFYTNFITILFFTKIVPTKCDIAGLNCLHC